MSSAHLQREDNKMGKVKELSTNRLSTGMSQQQPQQLIQPQQQQPNQQHQQQFLSTNTNNSHVLNGPSGELTMAFKDVHPSDKLTKGPTQQSPQQQQQQQQHQPAFQPPQRPQLQRIDSRPNLPPPIRQQQAPGTAPPAAGQQPSLRPRFPVNQQPGQGQPLGQQQQPPLFRPQQRFVAVNPPSGQVRQNFPGQQGAPLQRPSQPRPPPPPRPPLQQQQSFSLPQAPPKNESKLVRSLTVDQSAPLIKSNVAINPEAVPGPNVVDADTKSLLKEKSMDLEANEGGNKLEVKIEDSIPPKSLSLTQNNNGQSSLSPSPQPETVIEACKPKKQDVVVEKSGFGKPPKVPTTPSRKDGDNDSGVDESTQGNDHSSNGDHTARKANRSGKVATTPKSRSMSRGGGSRTPNMKSPDSAPGTPGPDDRKKIPMNKIQVGTAPSPNLKVVKSKIGSLSNTSYKPGGGNVKIEHRKIDLTNTSSRIGAKNENYVPSGGEKKIMSQKLQWNAKSKIGSLENATHKPKGGDKKIESIKLDFKDKAKSRVGSKDNMGHVPRGGDVKSFETPRRDSFDDPVQSRRKIVDQKLNIEGKSKIGSLDNVKHKPKGGEKKIFDDKDYLRQRSASSSHENRSMHSSQSSLPSQQSDAREPVSDENLNREN